jgi:putative endopeptidase
MVIAHEITHAFDSNGSKFDEFGNLSNWWTKKDYNNFQKLQQKVIKYYNKYEVLDGLYIDGKATVNENIADLGSISCITNLALNRNATTRDLKQMYKSLSNMWATTTTEEYQKLLLLQDNHAPAKYRVNATLSSTNTFYKVYNITKSNDMYIPEKQRITVW